MRKQSVTIDGKLLTEKDRYVLAIWARRKIRRYGDVILELEPDEAINLVQLLEMLGKVD